MSHRKRSRKQSGGKVWLTLGLVFLLILAAGGSILALRYVHKKDAKSSYEEMKMVVNDIQIPNEEKETEEADVLSQMGIEVPPKNLDWEALRQENADIYAWVYVPDTTVDYPVLQHPTDNSYYLDYNMDGTKGYPGCIYTEDYNTKTFTDIHTVLYGHNLKDGTMFSTLHNFEDAQMMNTDHYIFIYTEDYVYVYQIFAAYEYPGIHLLANYDLTNAYVYEDFLNSVYMSNAGVANIREDIVVTAENQIITLSTCTSQNHYDPRLRFLVTGVLLNPR